jgi:PAS domain S-box-containing protein
MTKHRSDPALDTEMSTLRAQLAGAQEDLRAIRSGNVDAVMVTGERGQQVFTLTGADRAYRQLVETMGEGAATLSEDGVILYCNDRLAKMLGRPLEQVIGSALESWLPPADHAALAGILLRAHTESVRSEIALVTAGGTAMPVYLSASHLRLDGAETVTCLVLTDLTEQRHLEQVAAAEQLARSILEQAADAIVVCDVEGQVMRASKTAQAFCKSNPLQLPFTEAFPLQTRTAQSFSVDSVLRGETLRDVDATLDHDGRELAFLVNAGPLFQASEILGCVVTWTDITARKRVEDDLRRKGFLLSEAQRFGSVGSWYWDLVGPMTWSEEMYRVYGVTPDTFEPTVENLDGLIHPDDRWAMQAWISACLANEGPSELEIRVNPPDGTTRYVLGRGELALDDGGQPAYMAGTVQDITERVQAEGTLRLQSAALNAAASAMVITDRNGVVEWSNTAYSKLSGYCAEESLGMCLWGVAQTDADAATAASDKEMWATVLAGNVWRGEVTSLRRDGSRYLQKRTVTPVKDERDEIAHFIAIKEDLTALRLLQSQLQQAQKMETVGQLAGGVAHDFNNLLTVINTTADLAAADLQEGDPLREEFREIRLAGERAATLTRQLLAFSRKQVLQPAVLNVNTVVANMERMLGRLIGENILLEFSPAPDLGSVKVDAGQLEQVVVNLVVNARDAMPDGGTLIVSTRNVTLDATYAAEHPTCTPGPNVLLAFTDTGLGMLEATRRRIFEPFFTTKGVGKGSGLGLSTVFGIVQQSGGRVEVYSEVGKGTVFKVYLPVVDSPAEAGAIAGATALARGTETVLVVEDDPAVRRVATRVLKGAGYTVLTANGGQQALALLKAHPGPVHLVLTDMVMPGMSGQELAARLGAERPNQNVLFTSGFTNDALRLGGLPNVSAQFIGKPYSAIELTRKVREVLDLEVEGPDR